MCLTKITFLYNIIPIHRFQKRHGCTFIHYLHAHLDDEAYTRLYLLVENKTLTQCNTFSLVMDYSSSLTVPLGNKKIHMLL